jgi:sec-independent protein translocase protein TatA
MGINGFEWVLIFVVALLLFGPKKLPELGRAVGKSIREFKNATSGILSDDEEKKPEAVKAESKDSSGEKAQSLKNESAVKTE